MPNCLVELPIRTKKSWFGGKQILAFPGCRFAALFDLEACHRSLASHDRWQPMLSRHGTFEYQFAVLRTSCVST